MSDISESPDSADHPGPAMPGRTGAGPIEQPGHEADDGESVEFDKIHGEASGPVAWLAPRQHPRGRALRTGKALLAVVASMVFLVTGAGWGTTQWLDGRMHAVTALDPHSSSITDAPAQYGDENVLLVGSDSRVGAQQSDGVGDPTTVTGARSDTVMIAHLAADRSRAVIVSFPRDLQIQRPPCAMWDPVSRTYSGQTDPGAAIAKLNSAYEVGGPLCATKVVQQLSGLAVTRFVGIDFQGFKALVDALGGVTVCVEHPLQDKELGTIIPEPGPRKINGDTALNFVRARHVVGDPTSDYGRITRQQRFLSSLLRQMLSPAVLLNPSRLGTVADAIAANTLGENIGTRALLDLGQSLEGLDPSHVLFVTVPTTGYANEHGNEELRVRDSAALFRAVVDGSALPGEQPSGARHQQRRADLAPVAAAPQPDDPRATERLVATGTLIPVPATASAQPRSGTSLSDTSLSDIAASSSAQPTTAESAPRLTPTTGPPTDVRIAPAQIQVQVLNGSGLAGSAADAAQELQTAGFQVSDVGDAPARVSATVIRYPTDQEAQALTLLAAVPDAVLQPDQTLKDRLVLVVGADFHGIAPSAPATPAAPPGPGPLETVNGADTTCS